MITRKLIYTAFLMSALGVLIIALPLLIRSPRDLREILALLVGIETPIILCGLQERYYSFLKTRYVPLRSGNAQIFITLPPIGEKQGEQDE